MAEWGNFYLTVGASAATLMGLMFVALTFGAKLITPETEGLARSILSPIFYHFAQVFVISCAALMPNVGMVTLCYVVIALAILRILMMPRLIRDMKRAKITKGDIERSDWILSVIIPSILYLGFITSGVCLLLGNSSASVAIGMISVTLLVLGSFSAWDMLVWMALKVSGE